METFELHLESAPSLATNDTTEIEYSGSEHIGETKSQRYQKTQSSSIDIDKRAQAPKKLSPKTLSLTSFPCSNMQRNTLENDRTRRKEKRNVNFGDRVMQRKGRQEIELVRPQHEHKDRQRICASSELNMLQKREKKTGEIESFSRKRPKRATDEAYSLHHLSPETLSINAKSAAAASHESNHIFNTQDFSVMDLHPRLEAVLKASYPKGGFGFQVPTVIQSNSMQSILSGKSTFIRSQTGSGKTIAYLLPIVQKLQSLPSKVARGDGTYALILAPTRELCSQIYDVLARLLKPFIWLVPGCICGGERRKSEKARLRKGVTVLVATPGRLVDHLKSTEAFRRDHLQFMVLDEVDRLMDMGFEKQIKDAMRLLALNLKYTGDTSGFRSGQIQTVLVSATITKAVRSLLGEEFGQLKFIDAEGNGEGEGDDKILADETGDLTMGEVPKQLAQHVMNVTYKLKLPALCALLRNCARKKSKVVLFVRTTATVDFLENLFKVASWPGENNSVKSTNGCTLFAGWPVYRLHGRIDQSDRQLTYKEFHRLKNGLLICSDVAARGLDLPDVSWIIQFDPPADTTDYVHRIGRTARRGQAGRSMLFLSPNEQPFLSALQLHHLDISQISLEATLMRAFGENKEQVYSRNEKIENHILRLQLHLEREVTSSSTLKGLALNAFQSFLRAYSSRAGSLKGIFQIRALHLGHVARSFALETTPSNVVADKNEEKFYANQNIGRPLSTEDERFVAVNKFKAGIVRAPSETKMPKNKWVASPADYI